MAGDDRPIARMLADPAWLAHRYDATNDAVQFIRVDRDARNAATFLTDEYLGPNVQPVAVARRQLCETPAPPAAPMNFIFHSAFCGSTLLAAALDHPGIATSLKEPVILNDLVGWRQRGADHRQVTQVLDDSLRLLSRPFRPSEAIVIKPSNIVNGLANAMLTLRPDAKAVFLHAPLRVFLASVARKGMWGRLWGRELFIGLSKEGVIDFAFDQEQYLGQTDIQIAALAWLSQHALFSRLAKQHGDRVRIIDSETLIQRPIDTLVAMGSLFALPIDTSVATKIAGSAAFTRHSKFGTGFSAEAREAEVQGAMQIHGDEIEKVALWTAAVADSAGLSMTTSLRLLA